MTNSLDGLASAILAKTRSVVCGRLKIMKAIAVCTDWTPNYDRTFTHSHELCCTEFFEITPKIIEIYLESINRKYMFICTSTTICHRANRSSFKAANFNNGCIITLLSREWV